MIVKNNDIDERHYKNPGVISDLIGAYAAMTGIEDSLTLVHGTIGCSFFVRGTLGYETYDEAEISSTGLAEQDVVFGGEERLEKAILKASEVFDPSIICVPTGTVGTLIGDDPKAMVEIAKNELNNPGFRQIPIFTVPTSVLEGDKFTGFNMVLEALVDEAIEEPTKRLVNTVNIFGVQADVLNGPADAAELERLLGGLGIQVNVIFCNNAKVENIKHASESNLNLIVSEVLGVEAAKKMEKKFNVPFRVVPYPIGMTYTNRFLTAAAEFFEIEQSNVKEFIEVETEKVHRAMRRSMFVAGEMRGNPLIGSTAAIAGDAGHVLSITRFLVDEWGVEPVLLILKSFEEDSLKLLAETEEELGIELTVLLKPDRKDIREAFIEMKPQMVFGGNYERFDVSELNLDVKGTVFIPIATYPRGVNSFGVLDLFQHPLAGFNGVIWLTEQIVNERVRASFQASVDRASNI